MIPGILYCHLMHINGIYDSILVTECNIIQKLYYIVLCVPIEIQHL